MADYIYLLDNRLSRAQRDALQQVRETARRHGMTVFLVGGAVRDLTSGAPIRDLNFAVQGDARQLADDLGQAGKLLGTHDLMQALYYSFPGGVRFEVSSTLSVSYPKPGKPEVQPASVLDDLRGRDFTANAMAISLNEGSYGLLMDPTNGVADVENRELRLLSNYGFLEDPSRMIRAIRLIARLGWQMEERTQTRYDNAKQEADRPPLSDWQRRYEAEAIFREEDPLRVLRKLEGEGWRQELSPLLNSAKVDEAELDRLRDLVGQLNALSIFPDTSAAVFPLLTAKLQAANIAQVKEAFALPGFAGQIEALDGAAKALANEFTSKTYAAPSAAWKLLKSAEPEAVLSMAFGSKSGAVQARLKSFFNEWPQAQQRIPYQQMQEMRITPELPGYDALLEDLFFAAMDGKLDSPEAIKAFLEPFSPPAAPPPPVLRRRAVKRESKAPKSRTAKAAAAVANGAAEAPSGAAAEAVSPQAQSPALATAVPAAQEPAASAASPRRADAVARRPTEAPAKAGVAEKQAATKPAAAKAAAAAKPQPAAKTPVRPAAPPAGKAPASKTAARADSPKAVVAKKAAKTAPAKPKPSSAAKPKAAAKSAAKAPSRPAQRKVAGKKTATSAKAKTAAKGKPAAPSAKRAPAPKKAIASKAKKSPGKTKGVATGGKKSPQKPAKTQGKTAAKAKRR